MGFLERTAKLTVKTLLMEVFALLTPTSCVNYKALLEVMRVETENALISACRITSRGYEASGQPEDLRP